MCKVAQSILQLIVGMLCARYLGPSNYGLINYAKSVVAFMMPVMQLGLDATLVQETLNSPEREGEILGTSLAMNLLSALCCMLLVCCFVAVANPGEKVTLIVCGLYSLSLLFRALEIIQYWFHGKLQSKYPSWMMLASYVVVSAYKIYLLASGKNVYWFALTSAIEYGVIGVGLLIIYQKQGTQKLSVSRTMANRLFLRSKYYILASLMVTSFQNIDHVMLKTMIGDAENGIYSAAITSAGVIQFAYCAIIDSARPAILEEKKKDRAKYEKNISRLYCVIIYMTLAQSIVFSLLAEPIITVLYGADYMTSIPVLRVLAWIYGFSFAGTIRNIWILAEGKDNLLWLINLCGVLANALLNACFIPLWGASGAAFASVLTQIFTNVIMGFIIKDIRPNNRLLIKGLNPKLLVEMVKELKESKQ